MGAVESRRGGPSAGVSEPIATGSESADQLARSSTNKTLVGKMMSTESIFARPEIPLTELVKLFATCQVRGVPV
jgi:hypothetical protein